MSEDESLYNFQSRIKQFQVLHKKDKPVSDSSLMIRMAGGDLANAVEKKKIFRTGHANFKKKTQTHR